MNTEQIVAGAQDAAEELGYDLTATSVSRQLRGPAIYGFAFDAHGQEAIVEFVVNDADVARFGLTLRGYAHGEIVDALRQPDA